jgi:hypothetical protein
MNDRYTKKTINRQLREKRKIPTCVFIWPVNINAPNVIITEPRRKRTVAKIIAWIGILVGDSLN